MSFVIVILKPHCIFLSIVVLLNLYGKFVKIASLLKVYLALLNHGRPFGERRGLCIVMEFFGTC